MGGFYIQYLEGMFVSRTIPFTSGVIVLPEVPCTHPVQGFLGIIIPRLVNIPACHTTVRRGCNSQELTLGLSVANDVAETPLVALLLRSIEPF